LHLQTEDTEEDEADFNEPDTISESDTDLNCSDHIHESIEGVLTEEEPEEDVLVTVHKLLKQALWVTSQATLKEIMILTAVTAYVQLYRK